MRRRWFISILLSMGALAAGLALYSLSGLDIFRLGRRRAPTRISATATMPASTGVRGRVCLPLPRLSGDVSLEEALRRRRSVRDYTSMPVSLEELSQLLWAAYGVTETNWSLKTTPSAGGTYPLDIYVVVKEGGVSMGSGGFLAPGSYRYDFRSHCLELVREGDLSGQLCEAALAQEWVRDAALNIVIFGVYERTTRRYGERGYRYVYMEAGHASQNIYLQATALGLGTVAVGAFIDDEVKRVVGADEGEPLYIMPVGRPVSLYDLGEGELRRYYEKNR